MTVLVCTLTAAGRDLARRLPWPHHHGSLGDTVRDRWADVDGLVLVAATGIAVRAVAPLLADKATDPAVVCVDDAGRYAIALTGGHAGGANALAREVAALLGAEAVVTTASDTAGLPALDDLPGFTATGDVAAVTRAWLDGAVPRLTRDPGLATWPAPPALDLALAAPGGAVAGPASPGRPGGLVVLSDRTEPTTAGGSVGPSGGSPATVRLRPRSLVLGVGSSRGADPAALAALVAAALAGAGLAIDAVGAVATLDRKADEPAIVGLAADLGVPLRTFDAATLARVEVPTPSPVVAAAVGTPSVAEAAAVVAGGPGAALVVTKRASGEATVAVARRAGPEGHLAVVGLGPGHPSLRTPAAASAVRAAEVVIGYDAYVELAADLLTPTQEVVRSPIGAETDRCREALQRAAGGQRVALVCSGDPGVYAMASLVLELAPAAGDPPVTVVPGVTASLAAAAVLGAPLGHDHASISLSDLLTPWAVIRARIEAAARSDFVVSLYNPRSQRRTTQLSEALAAFARHRPSTTPAAVVTDVGRPGQRVVRTTLGQLDPAAVGMLSLVVVGSTASRWINGRLVTPRGYQA